MDCSTPALPVHHQLPVPTQTHVHQVDDAIQPSHLLLSPSSPTFNLSQHQGLFQWVGSSHQVAKVLELHLSMNTQGWFPLGLTDWLDFHAVQGTLKSLLQHHNLKTLIFQCSAFFMIQFSHLYMTTGKTIYLIIQTYVSKVMSLLFYMLSLSYFFFQGMSIF